MKYINGRYYTEVNDKGYLIQPNENIILRERKPPKILRTQYQVQKETKTRKNQKAIKTHNKELEVKSDPKNNKTNF